MRKLNEQANEEAGALFASREVIRLMVQRRFTDEEAVFKPGVYRSVQPMSARRPTALGGGGLPSYWRHLRIFSGITLKNRATVNGRGSRPPTAGALPQAERLCGRRGGGSLRSFRKPARISPAGTLGGYARHALLGQAEIDRIDCGCRARRYSGYANVFSILQAMTRRAVAPLGRAGGNLEPDWITVSQDKAFGYGLPESHLLHSLQHNNALLLQRIITRARSLGGFLLDVLCLYPMFLFLVLLPVQAVVLLLIPGSSQWEAWARVAFQVMGAYALALLMVSRRRSLFKAFRERLQHVGEKALTLDFKRGELRVEERFEHAPERNFRFVLSLDRLRPNVKIHLHDPESDVDLCDAMRLYLGAPPGLRVPKWAGSKLEEPIYIHVFDNDNDRNRQDAEQKVQGVLELLNRRLNGAPARH